MLYSSNEKRLVKSAVKRVTTLWFPVGGIVNYFSWDRNFKVCAIMSFRGLKMEKSKFSLTHKDEELFELIKNTDQKTLAVWAIDCAERVLPYFEEKYPEDHRPLQALETLKIWIKTGVFKVAVIRKASLDAHAAAREVGEDSPACSATPVAGQAAATAHFPRHAYGSAMYAQQAIYKFTTSMDAVESERNWQYQHLLYLRDHQEA